MISTCDVCSYPERPLTTLLTDARCEELDTDIPTSYQAKTSRQLHTAVPRRRYPFKGAKSKTDYIVLLQASDNTDREEWHRVKKSREEYVDYIRMLKAKPMQTLHLRVQG
jgi:hypothetical protein